MASGSQNHEKIIELRGEKELCGELSAKEPSFRENSCLHATYKNLETEAGPASAEVETQIWDSHMKINSRFRKLLFHFRDEQARKKRPVEERKLKHQYQKFIGGAQQFYEEYLKFILSLTRVPELEGAAADLRVERKAQASPNITKELCKTTIDSCYSTLIRLGDLSRYFQTELVAGKREWSHAVNYYILAGSVKPSSGIFHNQLAIIALAEADHLQVTYYLYRALCAVEPHPTADGNLEIEFRKIPMVQAKDEKSLISSFTYFHAVCYKGVDFPERDEIENEILKQMTIQLKENSLNSALLQKLCLVNIAAEAHARTKPETNGNAPAFFQQLNVKTFFTLLQVLLAEWERFSTVVQQILPALRNYSSWLVVNSGALVSEAQDTPLGVQIKEFWNNYAHMLTLLTSTFSVPELPDLSYLLQEDFDTLGFSPLNDGKSRRYIDGEGNLKPKAPPGSNEDRVKAEILFRVRELVVDGLDLVVRKVSFYLAILTFDLANRYQKIPIILVSSEYKNVFLYEEEGELSDTEHQPTTSVEQEDNSRYKEDDDHLEDDVSTSASVSAFDEMDKMVDALVNSEADPSENFATDNETTKLQPWPHLSIDTNGGSLDFRVSAHESLQAPYTPTIGPEPVQSYSPGPPLPSIMNTPFALQPGEVSPRSRPSTATRTGPRPFSGSDSNLVSSLNYSTFQQSNIAQSQLQCSTPIITQSSSAFSLTQTPTANHYNWQAIYRSFNERVECIGVHNANDLRVISSPFNPSLYSSNGVPGSHATSSARPTGVIGRVPPSGQCG
ncbi:hypothetical protein PRK78_002028 [Emydomyces testavorans]|uniref:Uncharacterized protein n=1 Tax=Emydomyces testavorans TaxID=2070801 RepID=A0AAF0DDG7_9EURO|nr:hypothetical protein PRK78_002028 [Emydomyces testavorans]